MNSKKRKTTWSEKYKDEFDFLEEVKGDDSKAYCKLCSTVFSISHGGRSDIFDHYKSNRHQQSTIAATSSGKLTTFFKKIEASTPELEIAAKEAAFAFHTAKHNFSFLSNDCTSNLIKLCFDSKFSLARTKATAIVKNVLAPFVDAEVTQELNNANYLSVMTDTSNHGNIKMLPLVIRSFDPTKGVSNKKISLQSISNEKSETIAQEILGEVRKLGLEKKIICFAADNTNFNFGGVRREGTNNVWRKMQNDLNCQLLGCGCSAHILHNATSAGCQMLDVDIENLVYSLHKHFKLYTVRTESFKSICEEMHTIFKPLKSHCSTRFLSLAPAIQRLIEMFEPLKEYFDSLKTKCPPKIKQFFALDSNKFWLQFLNNQIQMINEAILKFERSDIAVFEISFELRLFKDKIKNRLQFAYLSREARQKLLRLDTDTQTAGQKSVKEFYEEIIDYLDRWGESLDGVENFEWMSMYKSPDWSQIEATYNFIIERHGASSAIIKQDSLFDEFSQMLFFTDEKKSTWIEKKVPAEKIWIEIFVHFRENSARLTNMEKLVEFAFCIPGTSMEVERIFSLIKQAWTDQKSCLDISTLNAIITLQYNIKMSCNEFFKKVKSNFELLRKVHSQEKYQN